MSEFLQLLETEVGKAVVAKFAECGDMSPAAMKAQIKMSDGLASYFVQVCRKVVDDLKAEAQGVAA